MAKSLRSKFKRKVRAIKRKRIEHREVKRLQKTVSNAPKLSPSVPAMDPECGTSNATAEKTKSNAGSINLKTLKLPDGSYPVWLSQRKVKKLKSINKVISKGKGARKKKKR